MANLPNLSGSGEKKKHSNKISFTNTGKKQLPLSLRKETMSFAVLLF